MNNRIITCINAYAELVRGMGGGGGGDVVAIDSASVIGDL